LLDELEYIKKTNIWIEECLKSKYYYNCYLRKLSNKFESQSVFDNCILIIARGNYHTLIKMKDYNQRCRYIMLSAFRLCNQINKKPKIIIDVYDELKNYDE